MRVLRNLALAVASLATVATATLSPAEAGRRERDFARGALAGIAGAVIVGGIARAHRPHYYAPGYHPQRTYYAPVYVAPRPVHRPVHRVVHRRSAGAHLDWCYARYRSYDAGSNTYQPYHGGRRACVSPYL